MDLRTIISKIRKSESENIVLELINDCSSLDPKLPLFPIVLSKLI